MSNWRPGPWEFDGCTENGKPSTGENRRYHQIDARTTLTPGSPHTVCDTSNRHHYISPDEDAANARLIAAAPELYEALEGILKLVDEGQLVRDTSNDPNPDWAMRQIPFVSAFSKAHQALTKARGGA